MAERAILLPTAASWGQIVVDELTQDFGIYPVQPLLIKNPIVRIEDEITSSCLPPKP